eukprot:g27850.t3
MTRASRPGPSGPELLALQHTATEEEVQQALLPFAAQWRTNPRHGTAVLSQLARQREAQRAWQVLKAMEQIHLELNVFHCSAVVSAFEKVSQWQAALGMPSSCTKMEIIGLVMFGGGAVVGRLGVESFNPLLFALIRECIAGPLLLLMALTHDGRLRPKLKKDWGLIVIMGFCIFANQAFMIIGVKLAGAIISSAWQCSQPIFTLLISLSLGWEPATCGKIMGILLSFLGGAFLVCYGQSVGSPAAIGNLLLALNCLGTSLYVIFSKLALERYPPLTVTAWAYLSASIMMAIVAGSLNNQCPAGNAAERNSWLRLHSMAGRILPNSFTYNSAISACEKCAEWEHALSLLQLMVRQDLCDVISYNSSISACEKAARWVESLLLFQDAR